MAISYVASEARYYGLSTDSKTSISVQEGAKIYYVDTKNTQVCHGGLWYDYNVSTSLNGSLVNKQTNAVVTANTNILTSSYTPVTYQNSKLVVGANTSGVLSVVIDGVSGSINSGVALNANQWYSFEIPLISGSTYNLQFSASATMQIKWEAI